ncbi:hypothetical protein SAMN02745121_06292 [Nannocystis exedens]|uniref:Uncharacterized protein n=1 Tax=Nannocystis exedens TaxID=54 RepID=A0A1I2EWR2_9BACT|nr:hypothetical protein [Nannocystis exedens]PCC69484.1 hypothetical protein NAEX_02506 [Nannocystis exedens]SFE97219.1 hypothetical protein SAMN02745121_06292 [Nannocystis exedens]
MRVVLLALAAVLACARLGGPRGDDGDEREVRVAGEPLTAEQQARLVDHARAGGLLWWRLPGPDGYRCEPWRLVPDVGDPERGRLVLVAPPPVPADSSGPPAPPRPADRPDLAQPVPADSDPGAPPARPELASAPRPPVPEDIQPSALLASPRLSPVPEDISPAALLASPRLSPVPEDIPPAALLASPRPSPVSEDIAPAALLAWPLLPPVLEDSPASAPPEPVPNAMSLGSPTIQLAYRLAEGHLTLTAPEHELPVAAPPGTQKAVGRALTCVFTGIALGGPAGSARRLILAARERFFFSEDACAAAGFADDPPGPDELRTVGCAGALADPATRARLERPPPRDAPDPAARLHRARAVHHLRRGPDGALVCDRWRNRPERTAGHGRLEHRGRDERGRFVRTYAYEVGPGYVTLQGPAEFRRVELDGQRTDVVRASSCLVTRGVTRVDAGGIDLGGERWYLSRSACDAARLADAPAPVGATPLLVTGCE